MMEYNEKQVAIMEKAEKLFAEKGFAGTSVRDIADEAGVNLAMISYYFGSKEKLLENIFRFRGENITLQLETMLQNKIMTSLEKVDQMIDRYVERIMDQQSFYKIMMREQIAKNYGPMHKQIRQLITKNQELIRQLIEEGQMKGEFKKNIDVPLMMAVLIGTTGHMISTQHFYRELNGMQSMTNEKFQAHLRKKLTYHLKSLFKAVLTYEE